MTKPERRKRHFFWLRICFSIVLIGILLALMSQPDFRLTLTTQLAALPLHIVGILLLLLVLMRMMQTIILRHALTAFGVTIRMWDCAQLLGLKGVYNLGITGGGIAAQLAQAKIALGVGAGRFIAATFLQAVVFVSSLLLLFGVVLAVFQPAPFPHQTIIASISFAGAAAVVALALWIIQPKVTLSRIRILSHMQGISQHAPHRKTIYLVFHRLYLYSLGIHVARSLRLVILLAIMSAQVPIGFSLTAVLGSDVLAQLPITPAGIGTRELALGYFGEQFSIFDLFLSAAIIDRTIAICFNLAHGLFAFFTLPGPSSDSVS